MAESDLNFKAFENQINIFFQGQFQQSMYCQLIFFMTSGLFYYFERRNEHAEKYLKFTGAIKTSYHNSK